ncbi:MAG: ABC transporter substrate-binding protein [Alphaproteobacteria bacterium]|nr:ABC transporter substrate-binding protein [Alphaproteobacteria bacterium]NCQ66740.1 ABC transporter substrate-binding protein [Alphaproteobacteria bacterium]NCT07191.1 ABC transporter substrate-binding protein [Alphaproteobacteria bacterium]
MSTKHFFFFFLCLLPLAVPQNTFAIDQKNETYEAFIADLGNNVIQILINKNEKIAKRKEQFRSEIQGHFALKSIGRFILARYWRRMNETQQQEYLQLFEDAVIENYAAQFDNYDNEKLIIKSSRETSDGGIIVKSDIRRPGKGEPLHIDWKVFNTKRGPKVLDVVVNNVSMSITLRNEYAGAIQNRGGIDGFLDYLREKIKKDQAAQRD